jgi:hypothetical protein
MKKKLKIEGRDIVEYKGHYPIQVLFLGLASIVAIISILCIGIMYFIKWIF